MFVMYIVILRIELETEMIKKMHIQVNAICESAILACSNKKLND